MNGIRAFISQAEGKLPLTASIALLFFLLLGMLPGFLQDEWDIRIFILYPVMLIFLPTFAIILSMFYTGELLLKGQQERVMARTLLILSMFSILLSLQHEVMLFGMTCPHAYSTAEALAHVGVILSASLPPITYAMALFLMKERWHYFLYTAILLTLNIVIMLILLPFTL